MMPDTIPTNPATQTVLLELAARTGGPAAELLAAGVEEFRLLLGGQFTVSQKYSPARQSGFAHQGPAEDFHLLIRNMPGTQCDRPDCQAVGPVRSGVGGTQGVRLAATHSM